MSTNQQTEVEREQEKKEEEEMWKNARDSSSIDEGKKEDEERSGIVGELQSGCKGLSQSEDVLPNKNTQLISTRCFTEEVYSVKIGEELITTTLTNYSSSVDKWVEENLQSDPIGLEIKSWKRNGEVDLIQLCSGQQCLLFKTSDSDGNFPLNLKGMLKQNKISTTRDLLGERSLICRGKSPFKSLFDEVQLMNMFEHAKAFIRDSRILKLDVASLLEHILKNEYKTPPTLSSTRWNSSLSREQVFYASYEAYRAYELGRKLLSGEKSPATRAAGKARYQSLISDSAHLCLPEAVL